MSEGQQLAVGLIAVLAAGGGIALHRQGPWRSTPRIFPEGSGGSSVWHYPPDATEEQRLALAKHIHGEAPLPAGFTLDHELEHRLTGNVDAATGEREIEVEVTDAIADLEEARLYVGGELKATATRKNGGIVDQPATGYSSATLNAWIPPDGNSWSASVQWDVDPGGPVEEGGFSVRVPWLRQLLARIFTG